MDQNGGDHIGLWNCGYYLYQSWRSYYSYDFTNAKTLTADVLYDTDSPTAVETTCVIGLVNTGSKIDINHDGSGFDIQTGFYKEITSWHRETWNLDVSNCNGNYYFKFFLYKGTYQNNYTVGFKLYSVLVSP